MVGSKVEPQRMSAPEGLDIPKNFKFIFVVMASHEGYYIEEWQKLVFSAGKFELWKDTCGTSVEAPDVM